MKFPILALDIEGTLFSNAVSQIPRPGLYRFLEFSRSQFPRMVLFTAVRRELVERILTLAAEAGEVPAWVPGELEYIEWSGPVKDLSFIPGANPQETLLVDDQESYVHPEQRDNWIPIPEFAPPYPDDDRALFEVEKEIIARLSGRS